MLAPGNCWRDIHFWRPNDKVSWTVDQRPLIGQTESVEDIQRSPNVLVSCSVDKSIRIWDCRAAPSKACMLTAEKCYESDVNAISWNRNEPLMASNELFCNNEQTSKFKSVVFFVPGVVDGYLDI